MCEGGHVLLPRSGVTCVKGHVLLPRSGVTCVKEAMFFYHGQV